MKPAIAAEFNELIHSPVRLRICALLRPTEELEFSVIRDTLALSDPHLSKNLKALQDAGFVTLRKDRPLSGTDARRRTWVGLTPAGHNALEGHLAALTAIANGDER
ncbi:MAG: transcriptional regulator [Leucobacter sp.]